MVCDHTVQGYWAGWRLFQSTQPVRGATWALLYAALSDSNFNPRTPSSNTSKVSCDFNPRTPHGVRLVTALTGATGALFQSTHPSRGATGPEAIRCCWRPDFNPRTPHGVRLVYFPWRRWHSHFNPRTPHGVRLNIDNMFCTTVDFNPRTPHGVRLYLSEQLLTQGKFQPTHPSRGATVLFTQQWDGVDNFNPRTPHGVRQAYHPAHPAGPAISIHAPREGCDDAKELTTMARENFNPRTP